MKTMRAVSALFLAAMFSLVTSSAPSAELPAGGQADPKCIAERIRIRDLIVRTLGYRDLNRYQQVIEDRSGRDTNDLLYELSIPNEYSQRVTRLSPSPSPEEIKQYTENKQKFAATAVEVLLDKVIDEATTDNIAGVSFGPLELITHSQDKRQIFDKNKPLPEGIYSVRRHHEGSDNTTDMIIYQFPTIAFGRKFLKGHQVLKELETERLIAWLERDENGHWVYSITTSNSINNYPSGRQSLASYVEELMTEDCLSKDNRLSKELELSLNAPYETVAGALLIIREDLEVKSIMDIEAGHQGFKTEPDRHHFYIPTYVRDLR